MMLTVMLLVRLLLDVRGDPTGKLLEDVADFLAEGWHHVFRKPERDFHHARIAFALRSLGGASA